MSHFSVLVISPAGISLEAIVADVTAQLAPYQENNMGDCPRQYLKRFDENGEPSERLEKKAVRYRKNSERRGASPRRRKYWNRLLDELPGWWENPNKKWDWWRIGGRWSDFFRDKEGGVGDCIKKGEADFEYARDENGREAAARYDAAMKLFEGLPVQKPWVDFDQSDRDKARKEYWEQPRPKAIRSLPITQTEGPVSVFDDPDDFLVDREKYVQDARNRAGVTFAVLKDGKWSQKGKMGWWATVSDEMSQEQWCSIFQGILNDLPSDAVLTVVDCHI